MQEKGNLYVIAAPSGTGKTTLVKALVDSVPKLIVSISHTTRQKRQNEMNGVHYHFVSAEEFNQLIQQNDFLEYAKIFDQYYGTSKTSVNQALERGIDVILEIDWQGNQQIKKIFPQTIGIFILPPSLNDLRNRLIKRNQDRPEVITQRLADVQEAVSHIKEFEFLIVNDDFEHALQELKLIIEANRLLKNRQAARYHLLINELTHINNS